MEGSHVQGNKHSGSLKCWEILGKLSHWQFLKKDSAQRSYLLIQSVSILVSRLVT
jgi:hypothetical protein